jgi:hypothetical protein
MQCVCFAAFCLIFSIFMSVIKIVLYFYATFYSSRVHCAEFTVLASSVLPSSSSQLTQYQLFSGIPKQNATVSANRICFEMTRHVTKTRSQVVLIASRDGFCNPLKPNLQDYHSRRGRWTPCLRPAHDYSNLNVICWEGKPELSIFVRWLLRKRIFSLLLLLRIFF